MNQLNQHIEALIFCSEQSLGIDEIAASLKLSYGWELSEEEIIAAAQAIQEKYRGDEFPFELLEISQGYQFLTKKDYHPTVNALIQHKAKKKLSIAQMETLSMIAYKQPISKSEIEHIRGVNCDYAIQKLLEKDLISISGKSDGPGRPILYSTSDSFMDYFGINSTDDLPKIREVLADQIVEATVVKPEDFTDNSVFNQTADLDAAIEADADMDTPNAEAETGDYDADAIDAEDHEDNAPEQPE
jgi:segregation and condensation protein B